MRRKSGYHPKQSADHPVSGPRPLDGSRVRFPSSTSYVERDPEDTELNWSPQAIRTSRPSTAPGPAFMARESCISSRATRSRSRAATRSDGFEGSALGVPPSGGRSQRFRFELRVRRFFVALGTGSRRIAASSAATLFKTRAAKNQLTLAPVRRPRQHETAPRHRLALATAPRHRLGAPRGGDRE